MFHLHFRQGGRIALHATPQPHSQAATLTLTRSEDDEPSEPNNVNKGRTWFDFSKVAANLYKELLILFSTQGLQ